MDRFASLSSRDQFLLVTDVRTGIFVDADPNLERVTGWRPDELKQGVAGDWLHPDDVQNTREQLRRLRDLGTVRYRTRILHANGEYVGYDNISALGLDGEIGYHWFRGAAQLIADHAPVDFYQKVVESTADIFVVVDENGIIESINPAGSRAYGHVQCDMVGRSLIDFAPPEAAGVLLDIRERAGNASVPVSFQMPAFDASGATMYLEGEATFDPTTGKFFAVERVVTDRIRRERELAIGHRFFELSSGHLALLDPDNRILRANPSFLACFGADEDALRGEYLCRVLGLEESTDLVGMIDQVRNTRDPVSTVLYAETQEGRRTLSCTLQTAGPDRTVYYAARDVTDEIRMADELLDRATRDQLTRLATREVFHESLEACLETGMTVGVVMADLDDFKRVNDGLGHESGDELLRRVGQRVLGAVRNDDLVARFGGDEFVILLQHLRTKSDAMLAAEKIRAAVAHPYQINGRELHTGVSIGLAVGTRGTHDVSQLLRESDAAVYEAKRNGRNTVRMFNRSLEATIEHEGQVEMELRSALREDRIDVDVQGLFSTRGRLIGVEVLARLVTSDGERRGPAHFLDVAQRLGLLRGLGEAVVERTCSRMSDWLRAHPDLHVAINADPSELASPGWVEMIESALARHCIAPSQLVIEATERGMIDPDGPTGQALERLRRQGVGIAIDDFGTGSSSLGYIRDRVVNAVKIDRSFTQELTTNPVARSITVAVVTLANDLDMPVVAEGVEDIALLPVLEELGCDIVQGFGLHRPQPIDDFLADPPMVVDVARPQPVALRTPVPGA